MNKDFVDSLIERLQELKIEEASILRQLKEARAWEPRRKDWLPLTPLSHVLYFDDYTTALNMYVKVERIKITNRVRLPKVKTVRIIDRLATVT